MERTFVLIHGAQHGGWMWGRVFKHLAPHASMIYAPSLTGMGDRQHLLHRRIDLEAHAVDIAETLKSNGLHDVVLVGHSFAGMSTSRAACLVPDRIAGLVFLDAMISMGGEPGIEILPPELGPVMRETATATGAGWLGRPTIEVLDELQLVEQQDRDWVFSLLSPQPLATFEQATDISRLAKTKFPKAYVRCSYGGEQTYVMKRVWEVAASASQKHGYDVVEIEGGHDAPITEAETVAACLIDFSESLVS
jgi:pimeloyl-ACP methyl ester carboxylesterase